MGIAIDIDENARTARSPSFGVGYWTWAPTYTDAVAGTESQVAELAPPILRIGGYNNDANVPDVFDHAELDRAVAYARAVGAELLLQLPLLATGSTGARPTPADAAELLHYANVERGYAIPYVSIGNEPDLYPDMGAVSDPAQPAVPDYDPTRYCDEMRAFVAAVKAVDPKVQVIGPDLGYKYQAFADWLTPILADCGELFDVVSIHRYPFESRAVSAEDASRDIPRFRTQIEELRQRMRNAGAGSPPLALTEANLAYVASAAGNPEGSLLGTLPHALWVADFLATAAELNLFTSVLFDLADPDEFALGLLGAPPAHALRPAYHALRLYSRYTGGLGLVDTVVPAADADPPRVGAYATRDDATASTELLLVNWSEQRLRVSIRRPGKSGLGAIVGPSSISGFRLPAAGSAEAETYGAEQYDRGAGSEPLATSSEP